ncbi:hypothetical protein KIH74_08880 [Kineosporia sp. J2-2]|uniref:Uncharacterized protein n=1 Tax=Kineosporia corallincola TaxID=2835133 RepID=A0ABS5TD75_9ACTN|nr:hypothetical protein [Kineosporia corallincola]MBT0769039.1 hypothetical protein [Kineosporia corallincola]
MASRKRRNPNRTATRPTATAQVLHTTPLAGLQPVVLGEWDDADGQLSAQEAADGIAVFGDALLEDLRGLRHRLDAELLVGSVFGAIEESSPPEVDDAARLTVAVTAMLHLIEACTQVPAPVTLGFLMLAAEQGPALSRQAARAAADRMLAAGVQPPVWAQAAPPELVRAWQVSDGSGTRSALGMVFSAGHRDHALTVTVAPDAGAADVALSEGREARELHDELISELQAEPAARIIDLDAAGLLTELRPVLAAEPALADAELTSEAVPNLYLVHARARQLAAVLGEPDVQLHADAVLQETGAAGPAAAV